LADAPFITECNLHLARETEHRELDSTRVTNGVLALLNDRAKGTYFVADCDSKPVGQLLITYEWSDWRNGNFWWIQSVYVAQEFRGNGIFRALFEHVHTLARTSNNSCGLRLYVESDNNSAQEVYSRLGMKRARYEMFEIDFVLS
jgi:GNAT superfamily N-acetyltransferase